MAAPLFGREGGRVPADPPGALRRAGDEGTLLYCTLPTNRRVPACVVQREKGVWSRAAFCARRCVCLMFFCDSALRLQNDLGTSGSTSKPGALRCRRSLFYKFAGAVSVRLFSRHRAHRNRAHPGTEHRTCVRPLSIDDARHACRHFQRSPTVVQSLQLRRARTSEACRPANGGRARWPRHPAHARQPRADPFPPLPRLGYAAYRRVLERDIRHQKGADPRGVELVVRGYVEHVCPIRHP